MSRKVFESFWKLFIVYGTPYENMISLVPLKSFEVVKSFLSRTFNALERARGAMKRTVPNEWVLKEGVPTEIPNILVEDQAMIVSATYELLGPAIEPL